MGFMTSKYFEEEGKVKDRGLIGGHYCSRRFRNCHFVPMSSRARKLYGGGPTTPPLTLFSREKDNNAETAANRALNRDHQGGDSTKRLLIQRCGRLASLDKSQWPLNPRKAEPKVLVRERPYMWR